MASKTIVDAINKAQGTNYPYSKPKAKGTITKIPNSKLRVQKYKDSKGREVVKTWNDKGQLVMKSVDGKKDMTGVGLLPAKPSVGKTSKPKPSVGKTVAELWKEKTGTSWSEAKKRGLTDGSLKANLALQKRLKAGETFKDKPAASKNQGAIVPGVTISGSAPVSVNNTTAVRKSKAISSGIGSKQKLDEEMGLSEYRKGGMKKTASTPIKKFKKGGIKKTKK